MSSILTNLPQLTAATNSDWLYIVDVSDTTDNPAGSSKKILRGDLYAQITGFTYLNNAITLSLSDNSTYQVVINTMTGLTINGVLSATTYANLPLGVWTTGSTGNYSIKAVNDSGLDATGNYAVAEGYDTLSSGYASHAEGFLSIAQGDGSHAEGGWYDGFDYYSGGTALGKASHAEGVNTTASGYQSHAEGELTTASGNNSHAEGRSTTAQGPSSHAEGQGNIASGFYSHAEGNNTTASGAASHAEGSGSVASTEDSHAEGRQTTASGLFGSHAGGNTSVASGNVSFIHSTDSLVTGDRSAVLGGQNITGTTDDTVYVPYFNIQSATTDNSLTEILVIDINGDVKKRTVGSIGFTGGTVSGATIFTGGLSANTISATTYYNLPLDVFTTGGTYDNGIITFTNNSGGTFNVSGLVTGDTYWTSGSTGNYSIKAKNDSGLDATGDYAVAEGYATTASGDNSHAEGNSTIASGDYSHTEGYYSLAQGEGSHAEGGWNDVGEILSGGTALGKASHAEGSETIAGWRGFSIDSGISGVITLNSSYGDVTSEFTGNKVILDEKIYTYNTVTFNSTNTEILLNDITFNGGTYIADLTNLNSQYGDTLDVFGRNTHAEGNNTKSLGVDSHTEGYYTIATGAYGAHAEGNNTTANAWSSHAEGERTTASGMRSHAEGELTTASGIRSHTEGYLTVAQGINSHAEGQGSRSLSNASHAEGANTTAIGQNSHTEGQETIAGWKGFTVDSVVNGLITLNSLYGDVTGEFITNNTIILDDKLYGVDTITFSSTTNTQILLDDITVNSGTYIADIDKLNSQYADNYLGNSTHAEGNATKALGDNSHAEGIYTIALGSNSHAEGYGTFARGDFSHAEGGATNALGFNSHAEGNSTIASGGYSHAEGSSTIASGDYSHAGGNTSIASGDTSFIHSTNSVVLGHRSVVLGGQNITGSTDDTVYVPYFNIQSVTTDNSLTEVLVIDTNGDVKKRTVSSVDTYTTGFTFDVSNYDLTIQQNNGQTDLIVNLGILSSDVTITGGTYNPTTGIAEFTNNTGGTFSVSGFLTGMTDTYVSGFTYSNNNLTIKQTAGKPDLTVNISALTGLTINGGINITGQTTTGSISATTYYNLPQDIYTTGGTYNNTTGVATFTNNSGGTFNVSGFFTGSTDNYTTGYTYSDNTFTIKRNNGLSDLTTTINTMTGLTINGNLIVTGQTTTNSLSASTITATTITADNYENLPFTDNQTLEIIISGGSEYAKLKDTIAAPSGGTRVFEGNVVVNSGFTANTISATTYYNLPASVDTYTTGFTFNVSNYDLTIKQNNGQTDLTVNLGVLSSDVTITGGTYNSTTGVATFTNNTGGTFSVSGFLTGMTDTYVSGFTYSNNNLTIKQTAGRPDLSVNIDTLTGLTINGNLIVTGQTTTNSLSANTITATTITADNYENLPFTDNQTVEIFLSGGTEYLRVKDTISAPSGGTRTFDGNVKVNSGFTANTISATTYYNLPASTDTYTTGGTYNNTTGVATFTNNSGGTFNVSGFYTGSTDNYTTGYTYSNNTFTIKRNNGLSDLSVNVNTMTGLTINGNLNVTGQTTTNSLSATTITATTITATDYQNLPFTDNQTIEGFVSGSTTYVRIKDVVSAPSGGTRTFQGNVVVNSGFTANTISATTYYNLPASVDTFTTGFTFNVSNYDLTIKQNNGQTDLTVNLGVLSSDMTVTGGTYNPTTGIATFTNNTGGTFDVSGFLTGMTDTYVSGFTYSDNNLTIKQTAGKPDLSVNIDTLTGLTINGNLTITGQTTTNSLSANTISATTYYNLPMLSGAYLPLSGGTVTGGTSFTNGLTANTISATTLQFDTTYTGTVLPGQIAWDSNFGTLQQGLVGGNVTQKIGETSFAMVKNVETTTINKGQVVYVFGATGDKISVKLASNTGDTTSSKTLGIAAEDIAVNQNGLIITQGTLDGLNLGSYTAGDILWLSSTPGQFTTVKQYAPSHLVFIGVVQRANNGNGQIYVKPQNGYEIDELHNVLATGATYGDLLVYSAYNGSDIWVNTKTLTGNYVINGNLNVTGGTQSIFSGKVGVGLNNPVSQLHVRSTAIPSDREIIAQFDVSDDSSYFRISNVTGVDGNFIPSLEGYNSTEKIAMYFLAVGTTDTGTESLINFNARIGQALVVTRPLFKWSNYDSTKMTMLANGNLGIGTETPSYKLDVSGTTRLKGVSAELTIDDATWAELKYGTDNYFRAQGDQAIISGPLIRLFDGSQETMRITGGNVSIGTTVTSPTARLHVNNTGSTNSFLVEDDSNPDSTPFVIDNTGNVGIGTTTPTAKLHVSGDTRITGTLTATTISATTYQNLPKVAFSPINVGVCDTAPTAASTQYYYQTIGEVTTTLSKVKLWGFSGSDLVLFGIYRGTLGGSMTLIGQASGTCTTGPNELTLTAETGQNLTITAGEDLVVGYYPDGTSWRTIYDVGISDINFGITNATNITSMPATPTGTATAIRFACTLY